MMIDANAHFASEGKLGESADETDYRNKHRFSKIEYRCSCGKRDCWTRGLLPLRAHVAGLFRAILALGYCERLTGIDRSEDPHPGVTYALSMAGGISSVKTDPIYVNDSQDGLYCGTVWDFEERERHYSSEYTEGLITFNFMWSAYEAAIETATSHISTTEKLPARARKIFESEATSVDKIRNFDKLYRVARHFCLQHSALKSEIIASESKHALRIPGRSAELVRIFRNHVAHGKDEYVPENMSACWRFHAISQLLLVMIQYFILRTIDNPRRMTLLSANIEELGREPAGKYISNLHYQDSIWRSKNYAHKMRNGRSVEQIL